jgi:hypothetical protein
MPVFTNEERLICRSWGKKRLFSKQFCRWRGLENRTPQIEEAVVSDRFLLAVAKHPKVREKNYFFFAAAFFAGAFLPADFAAFFLATVALLTEPVG